jgi:hypothetical protein
VKRLPLFLLLASALFAQSAHYRKHGTVLLNDPDVTPGEVRTTSKAAVCSEKTPQFRNTTEKMKNEVYAEYGVERDKGICRKRCEVDHLVSLELGGADAIKNLWIQPADGVSWSENNSSSSEMPDDLSLASSFSDHVPRIVLEGSQKEMSRIYAMANVAAMQDIKSPRYFTVGQFPRYPMGSNPAVSPATSSDHAIAPVVNASDPEPAVLSFVDFSPEPLSDRNEFWPTSAHKLNSSPQIPGWQSKDKLENWLHAQVCSGKMDLAEAQATIRTDWYAEYLEMQKEKQ